MKKFIIIFIFLLVSLYAIPYTLYAQPKVDFILDWSTGTYIPPTYPGKALPTLNSSIKVTAIPTAKLTTDPSLFFYNWFFDNRIVNSASGQGKTDFSFLANTSYNDKYQIGVKILDQEGKLLVQKNISIKTVKPELILYSLQEGGRNDTERILESARFVYGQKINFTAAPYFFNVKNLKDLDFIWQLDDQFIDDPKQANHNFLTLKLENGEKMNRVLKITTENKNNPKEKSQAQMKIAFWWSP